MTISKSALPFLLLLVGLLVLVPLAQHLVKDTQHLEVEVQPASRLGKTLSQPQASLLRKP